MAEPNSSPGADNRPTAGASSRIVELDGWRGISITFVVVVHLVNHRYRSDLGIASSELARVLAAWSVDIFFITSGFIITRLALKERQRTGTFSISGFYFRRFFRIVPPFYACLAATGLASIIGLIDQPLPGIAAAAGFTCNLSHIPCGWFAGHSWTLAFEEQFYLSFPLIFRLSGKNMGKILSGLLIFLVLFPFFRYLTNLQGFWHVAADLMDSFSFLCIGGVVAAYEKTFGKIAASGAAPCISLGVAVGLCALAVLSSASSFPPASPGAYVQASLNVLLLPPFLAWAALLPAYRRTPLNRLLRMKWVQFLGAISYSLYLWQEMFTAEPGFYLTEGFLTFPPFMLIPAIASYYWIERPCAKLRKKLPQTMRVARRWRPALGATAELRNIHSGSDGAGARNRVHPVKP